MGAVRGMTVKGAPYSRRGNHRDQSDAGRRHAHPSREPHPGLRDNEGRTRRESPDNITITDPVANVTYLLNPKTMTGQKLAMAQGNFMFLRNGGRRRRCQRRQHIGDVLDSHQRRRSGDDYGERRTDGRKSGGRDDGKGEGERLSSDVHL